MLWLGFCSDELQNQVDAVKRQRADLQEEAAKLQEQWQQALAEAENAENRHRDTVRNLQRQVCLHYSSPVN